MFIRLDRRRNLDYYERERCERAAAELPENAPGRQELIEGAERAGPIVSRLKGLMRKAG